MPKIPFSLRRSGRYYFRRRVRLQNGKDIHVVVPLSTCDGQEARERSAMLAAHFDRVRRAVNAYFESNDTLDADAIRGIFENELRHCLAKLVLEFHDPARNPAMLVHEHRTKASAYDLAQRPGQIIELSDDHRRKLADAGHDQNSIEDVAMELDIFCSKHSVRDEMLALVAEGLGLAPTDSVIGRLKHLQLQAKAEAHRLAAHFMDDDVQSAFDQEEALMAKRRQNGTPLTFAQPAPHETTNTSTPMSSPPLIEGRPPGHDACEFKTYHSKRFSDAIPGILESARKRGHWNRGLAQYERVLRTFAWITGDKPLGDYNHCPSSEHLAQLAA